MSITKNRLSKNKLTGLLGPVGLVLLWVFLNKFVSELYLPNFRDTLIALMGLLKSGLLWLDAKETFFRLFFGFSLACAFAVPFGVIVGASLKIYRPLEIVIDFFRSLPSSTLYPLFLLVFGIGDNSKIAVVVYTTGMIIFVNTIYGVQKSSKLRAKVAKLYGASPLTVLARVSFFDSLPQIFSGLRIGISIALIVEIVTEMVMGTQYGLGRRAIDSYISYNIPQLYATIVVIGILGLLLAKVFSLVEVKLIHWTSSKENIF